MACKGKTLFFLFFFSRGFLFLWIRYINYKPIWQVSAITSLGGEGKGSLVLTHFWKREVGALLPVRVSRHTSLPSPAGLSGPAEDHGIASPPRLWAAGDYVIISGFLEKKKKKANYLFWRKRRKNLSPTDSKPNGQTNGENKADGCFCHIFLHNHCFLPRLCLQNLVAAIVHVTSKLADDLRLGRGWQRAHMGEPAPEQMLSLH